MSATQRIRLVDEVIRRLAAALRAITLYAPGHPLVERSINSFAEVLNIMHSSASSVTIGIVGEDLVVQDTPIPRAAENMEKLVRQFRQVGIERIVIDKGAPVSELMTLVQTLGAPNATPESSAVLNIGYLREQSAHRRVMKG